MTRKLHHTKPPLSFPGFERPRGTYIPDVIIDFLAPHLSEAELRVLLYIARRTFGFDKVSDAISLSQMEHGITTKDGKILDFGTGLSRKSIIKGCAGLVQKGIIRVDKRLSDQGDNEINVYTLHFKEGEGVVDEVHHPSVHSTPRVVEQVHPQETVIQETDITSNSNRESMETGVGANDGALPTFRGGGFSKVGDVLKSRAANTTYRMSQPESTPSVIQMPQIKPVRHLEQTNLPSVGKRHSSPQSTPLEPLSASRDKTQKDIEAATHKRIAALAEEVSAQVGDMVHVRQNISQMSHIFVEAAPQRLADFVDSVYAALAVTKESRALGTIRGRPGAYFFKVLRSRLHLPAKAEGGPRLPGRSTPVAT